MHFLFFHLLIGDLRRYGEEHPERREVVYYAIKGLEEAIGDECKRGSLILYIFFAGYYYAIDREEMRAMRGHRAGIEFEADY